jgi:hypothetical protein
MADTSFDRVREIGARYWKPLFSISSGVLAATLAVLNGSPEFMKQLGLRVPFSTSTTGRRWIVIIVLATVFVLLRFQRLTAAIIDVKASRQDVMQFRCCRCCTRQAARPVMTTTT